MSMPHGGLPTTSRCQQGAAAIEAALMFVVFFTLFYAIVSYSLPMLMLQAFNHAAANGARAALAVEPADYSDEADYIENGVTPRVRQVVGESLAWLPTSAQQLVLGPDNQNVDIQYDSGMLSVTVRYAGYRTTPLIPVLHMPGIGELPRLPEDISGHAMISL